MKVIDLLNKIAKGEEVPKKIEYNHYCWTWCKPCKIYETIDEENKEINLYGYFKTDGDLNDEIEIIEEEKNIEHYDYSDNPDVMFPENIAHNFQKLNEDLDVIVRELNKIKKEGK